MSELDKHFNSWAKHMFKRDFVDNECHSDEYPETQPGKGLSMIAEMLEPEALFPYHMKNDDLMVKIALGSDLKEKKQYIYSSRYYEVMDLTIAWLQILRVRTSHPLPRYVGNTILDKILEIYFDWCWEQGKIPSGETIEILQEDLEEFLEEHPEERERYTKPDGEWIFPSKEE